MARKVKKIHDELLDGFSVTSEKDSNVHVRPVVDEEIIDIDVEEIIDTDTTDLEIKTDEVEEIEEVKEVVEPVTTDEKPKTEDKLKYNKNIDFVSRGFSSFDEAVGFIKTDYFKGLGKEDREEYLNWLQN